MKTVSRISLVATAVALILAFGASVASAQQGDDPYVGNTTVQTTPLPPDVRGATAVRPEVANNVAAAPERSSLALTGSDTIVLLAVGGGALVAGAALLAIRRRNLAPTA